MVSNFLDSALSACMYANQSNAATSALAYQAQKCNNQQNYQNQFAPTIMDHYRHLSMPQPPSNLYAWAASGNNWHHYQQQQCYQQQQQQLLSCRLANANTGCTNYNNWGRCGNGESSSPISSNSSSSGDSSISLQQSSKVAKTRTKDKYRIVYTKEQILGLEAEFCWNKYICLERKAELSERLSLSDRQIKIWFQNRRAKERRQNKKLIELQQQQILENQAFLNPLKINNMMEVAAAHAHHNSILGF